MSASPETQMLPGMTRSKCCSFRGRSSDVAERSKVTVMRYHHDQHYYHPTKKLQLIPGGGDAARCRALSRTKRQTGVQSEVNLI